MSYIYSHLSDIDTSYAMPTVFVPNVSRGVLVIVRMCVRAWRGVLAQAAAGTRPDLSGWLVGLDVRVTFVIELPTQLGR